jgi:hypothetical protein
VTVTGFATESEVAAALAAWPGTGWHEYASGKRASLPGSPIPEPLALLLHRMATAPGIPGVPDLGLWGAGLHEMPPGPGLGWHTDAERHSVLGLKRLRSGVLYLCGDGDLEFRGGGHVRPAPGRFTVFDGGVAHRVGPVTRLRRSVALFWYGPPAAGGGRATFEAGGH